MTLIDTSAWVEFLRGTGSEADQRVADLLAANRPPHTTDVVVMEVLAGGRDEAHVADLRGLLSLCDFLPMRGLADFEDAASLYRTCRRAGATVRALTDCLIAATAIRAGVEVLHFDRDFDALARHTALRVA